MSEKTSETNLDNPAVIDALSALADLEKDFAAVELDALRAKEYASKELYATRSKLLQAIPNFWSTVFTNGPDELQAIYTEADAPIIDSISNLRLERYQIKSDSQGEPRSLRFTFEFDHSKVPTPIFQETKVVKEFEFVVDESVNGGGALVSKPVNFKWTKAGKKGGYNKMLDLAEQLYQAEQALVSDKNNPIEQKEREGLWQYEKLREALEKEEEQSPEDASGRSFLEWFGYRGAVASRVTKPDVKKGSNGNVNVEHEAEDEDKEDEDEDDGEDDGMLDVEIFPAGDEIATALAEDLWPNVMDYFMRAQEDEADEDIDIDEEDDDDDDDDPPELVKFEGFEDEKEERPAKKQRTA